MAPGKQPPQYRVTLEQVSGEEADRLLGAAHFRDFHPVRCSACQADGPFERRLFRIGGARSREPDGTVEVLVRAHLARQYGAQHVFFRVDDTRYYAETARCVRCGSTAVVFDIEFTDEVLRKVAELTGRSVDEVRSRLEELTRALEEQDRARPSGRGGRLFRRR